MKLHLIVIATSIPLNAYAAEAEDAHSYFCNQNYGSSYINASNLSPTTIVGPHLRLTSGTFGLTGTYSKKELGINLKKYQFGIFDYKNSTPPAYKDQSRRYNQTEQDLSSQNL